MGIDSLWQFLKHPEYTEDPNKGLLYRLECLGRLMIWALGIGLLLALMMGIAERAGPWDLGEHAIETLLEEFPIWMVFMLGAIVAPMIEELIFRAPLWFFRESRHFPVTFYISVLAFGMVHLGNFPNLFEVVILAPLLISPQLCLGAFLGFIRVRFGLAWAVVFHAAYNSILLGPLLILMYLEISVL